MKNLTLSAVLLLSAVSLQAAASGKTGADFLEIPAGARPAALGGTYAAIGNDAYSPVWNPAGMASIPETQMALQHLSYLDGSRYEFGSLVLPVFETGAVALSVRDMASGSIPGTDISGNSTADFSTHFGAYSLSYGQNVTSNLSLGITGSMISAKLESVSASAYSFDAGALYRPNDKLSLALVGANFGSQMTFLKEKDSLPSAIKLEGAYKPMSSLTVAAGATYRLQGPVSARAGLEFQPFHGFALRAGYKTENSSQLSGIAGLTAGAGIEIFGQELSYAWVPFGDLGDTHYVSLVIKFGSSQEDSAHAMAPAKSSYSSRADDQQDSRPTMTPEKTYKPVYKQASTTSTTKTSKKAKANKKSLQFSNGYRP